MLSINIEKNIKVGIFDTLSCCFSCDCFVYLWAGFMWYWMRSAGFLIIGPVKKLLWVVVIIAITASTMYTVCQVIIEFFNRPVDVVIKMERKSDLVFPAVTLCNINLTRQSQLFKSPLLESALDDHRTSCRRRSGLFIFNIVQVLIWMLLYSV